MSNQPGPDPVIRSGPEESAYLLRRAEYHRQLSEKTPESGAKMIHLRFQRLYEQQAAVVALVLPG